ncbi:hypothetical protein JCGZ_24673 [Jatropha curcas]|uniref:Protein kinase domain-containing protein n=1 Tax=Jatropha curcas TaxID=180498 RepID=A0A067L9A7_JATCU|nr:pollen receptor-like kinase 3 [Jatropha curcas]KDP40674.1 hypothetical protein JCGZ_24673 [Jatropha curcas]
MALNRLLRPIFLLFIVVFILQFDFTSSITQSEALIQFKDSLTNKTALSSWTPGSFPCTHQWEGILCSNGIVTGIRLEKMGLSGNIDIEALSNMTKIRSISFAHNSFSGPIPELYRLDYLKNIYLMGNEFSGEIPSDFFLKMHSLKKIWLSDNKFTGEIPSSLIYLTNLMELHLENNQFTGTIPFVKHSRLQSFNVSNNKLRGQIPAGLLKFSASSFDGNEFCGEKIGKECNRTADALASATLPASFATTMSASSANNNVANFKKTGAGIITLGAMLLSVAIVVLLKMRRSKEDDMEIHGKDNEDTIETADVQVSMPIRQKEMDFNRKSGAARKGSTSAPAKPNGLGELVVVNPVKGVFGLIDLMKASAEVLGNGALGSSYKAVMANGATVVVKRLREMNALGNDKFDAEIRKLATLKHANILTPLAFHYRKDEKLLIYTFIPKGSLLYLLHGDRGPSHASLNWAARLKIVKGIAKGLGYIHTELTSCDLPHGNLKSSNVLIGPDNEPLLSEFGFSPLISPTVKEQALFAYKAPEVAQDGLSPQCDVYCLGVIILEIMTGKCPSQCLNNDKEGIDLVQWVETAISEGNETELLDPEIAGSTNSVEEMRKLLVIGALCAERNPTKRLDLREAIKRIEEIKLESVAPTNAKNKQSLPSGTPHSKASSATQGGNGENSSSGKSYSFTDSEQFSLSPDRIDIVSNDK